MAGAGLTVVSAHVDSSVSLTTSSVTLVSIAGGSFISGHRYLCIGSGSVSMDGVADNNASVWWNLPDGTSDSMNQMRVRYENGFASRAKSFGFTRVVTADGVTGLTMRGFKASSSGGGVIWWPRLMAIDLDSVASDIFIEQDDWLSDGVDDLAQVTDGTDELVATLSNLDFGNDGGGKADEDWLILGSVTAYHDGVVGGTNLSATAKLSVDQGSGDELIVATGHTLPVNDNPRTQYLTIPVCVSIGKTHGNEYLGADMVSGTHDVKLKLNGTNAFMKIKGAQLFALRLNAFLFTTDEVETDLFTGSTNVTATGVGASSGTSFHTGSRANLPFRDFDTSPKQRLNFGLFIVEENSTIFDTQRGATFHVWENSSGNQQGQGAANSNRFHGDKTPGTPFPLFWFHDELIADYSPGAAPLDEMNARISAENVTTGTGFVTHSNFISFYTTLVNATVSRTPSLNMLVGEKHELSSILGVTVGELTEKTVDLSTAVAETRSEIASLNNAIAAAISITPDLQVEVAATYNMTAELEVLAEGSVFHTILLRIVIASEHSLSSSIEVLKGATIEMLMLMDLAVTDAPFISIEPDRPTAETFLTVTDMRTSRTS